MRPKSYFYIHAFAVLTLSAASVLAQAAAPQLSSPQSSSKTNDALDLVKQGQAVALYNRALQLSPDLFQAQLAVGMALDLEGKYQVARLHLEKAITAATAAQ